MKKIAIVLLAALMLLAISCEEQPQHEHKFLEEWKNNETQHWHECECKEKSEVADHEFETITVESTCTKKGSETVKCKVCGYVKSTKELELKAHTPSDHKITDSTCSKEGTDVVECTVCGTVISSETIKKKAHTPSGEHVIVEATCNKFGSDSVLCSVCGETLITYSDKVKHTPGSSQVAQNATCFEEGLSVVKCTVCEEVVSSKPIPCVPHTWGAWELDSETKLKTRVCTICETSETSGTTSLTPEAFKTAMAYDNLIGNVSGEDMYAVMSIDEEARVLSSDKLLYDVRNMKAHITGEYSFEVKLANEETYHKYSFTMIGMGEITDVVIDNVKPEEGYNAEEDPCIDAYNAYMKTIESQKTYTKFENASVTSGEETYSMSFESEYDSTKHFETRHMKITDIDTGIVKLEYSLKLVGPKGAPYPISELAKHGDISEAEAVGLFTFEGIYYDIVSVNKNIEEMFRNPLVY